MPDYLEDLRDVASNHLKQHFAASPDDDTLFALFALSAPDDDSRLMRELQKMQAEGRYSIFTQAALASLYQQRGFVDLATKTLVDLVESLPPVPGRPADGPEPATP